MIDRWFVRVVCFECAERAKALMWFVALRTLLFRWVESKPGYNMQDSHCSRRNVRLVCGCVTYSTREGILYIKN